MTRVYNRIKSIDELLLGLRSGLTASDVARSQGVSRERVRQIWLKQTGLPIPSPRRWCETCSTDYFEWRRDHDRSEGHRQVVLTRRVGRRVSRFWAEVDRSAGPEACWPWLGSTLLGYGRKQGFGGGGYAHRAAYILSKGPIPKRLTIDHLCNNRACVNPAHLEAVTQRVNVLRSPTAQAAINARKTHCKYGHPFDEANTYFRPGRSGRERACRACSNARNRSAYRRAYRRRQREETAA